MFEWLKKLFYKQDDRKVDFYDLPIKKPAVKRKPRSNTVATKPGLYANIHAKQERISKQKASGAKVETMRKPGTKGAPTAKAFKEAAKTTKDKK